MTLGLERRRRNKKRYLLEDRFLDARAAGAVNGTLATDGHSLRTVTDTANKISLAGSLLTFATGETANDAIWYPSIARATGLVLLTNIIASEVTNGIPAFGWDSAAAGAILDHIRLGASGALQVVVNGGTALTVGTYAAATYDIAALMRATGIEWFIKGGAFTTWRFLWASLAGTAAGFPAIASANTTAVFTADHILIPADVLWLAAPLLSDSFNRTDGVLGTTDGAGHAETTGVGSGGSGKTWVFDAGVWTISGNAAVGTPTEGANVVVNGTFDTDTVWVKGSGWSIAGGKGSFSASANNAITQNSIKTIGVWYKATWDIVDAYVGGGIGIALRDAAIYKTLAATYTQTFRAATTYDGFYVSAPDATTVSVDNLSMVPLTLSSLFATRDLGTPNVYAHCEVKTLVAGTQAGMVLRLDSAASPANFVLVYFDGVGNIEIVEAVAGVYTQLGSVASSFITGDVLVVDLDGAAYRVYKVATSGTGTATLISAGTTNVLTGNLHGTFSTYSGNAIERIAIWPKGTGGEYEWLSTLV